MAWDCDGKSEARHYSDAAEREAFKVGYGDGYHGREQNTDGTYPNAYSAGYWGGFGDRDEASLGGGRITDAAAALEFMLAGNARVTLRSVVSGKRYSYRVNVPKRSGGVSHFVSVLTGSDNETQYTYMGHIMEGRYGRGRRSTIEEDDQRNKAFEWAYAHLLAGNVPDQLEFWHEGRCGRCGRVLTVPESIERGIGPECIKHVSAAA